MCLLPSPLSVPDVVTEVTVQRGLSQLVAIEAGDHGNFLFLPELIPILYRTVTHCAFHVGVGMFLVTEIHQVGKRIDRASTRSGRRRVEFAPAP